MESTQKQGSEVARLLQQIQDEYESAVLGVKGLAYGTAQHKMITQKTEKMFQLQEELQSLIGDAAAIALVAQQLDACPDIHASPA